MIDLLVSGVTSLRRNCVQGLELNIPRNTENAQGLGPSLMQFKRRFGYSRASAMAKQAAGDVSIVRAALAGTED
jgi:aspartate ammonia-lyase